MKLTGKQSTLACAALITAAALALGYGALGSGPMRPAQAAAADKTASPASSPSANSESGSSRSAGSLVDRSSSNAPSEDSAQSPSGKPGLEGPPGLWTPGSHREWYREPLTDDRWKELGDFMKQYSPKRWERIQDLSDDRKERIGRLIAFRYDVLERLKDSDPKVYDIRLKRMQIEDNIFGLGWDLTHSHPDKPQEIRGKLREQVRALVDNKLDERKARIGEMKERLELEQARLKQDQANAKATVAQHMKAIEDSSQWPRLGDFAGSGPGPRGQNSTPPTEATAAAAQAN